MRSETRRNFIIGSAFLLAIAAMAVYSSWKTEACSPDADAVVTIVDFTDPIGDDARARLKDIVWKAVDSASDHANIVLRGIVGKDQSHKQMSMSPTLLCRPEKPSFLGGLKGPTLPQFARWEEFKGQVCGTFTSVVTDSHSDSPSCGDSRRQGSFFEQRIQKSTTSPVAEQVLDGIRRHLPPEVKHWHLIVATDWREYNPPLFDVETQRCDRQSSLKRLNELLLVGKDEKLLVGTADSGSNNQVDSILISRSNMTQTEADCLEELADGFFRLNMASPPPNMTSSRLSVTEK